MVLGGPLLQTVVLERAVPWSVKAVFEPGGLLLSKLLKRKHAGPGCRRSLQ